MIFISNHYWIIAGSTTDVYSSASNTLAPVADAGYVAWAAGNAASPIASETELAEVLQSHGSQLPAWLFTASDTFIQPTPTTYTNAQLAAYTSEKRWQKEQGGITLSSGMPIKTDDRAQAKINGVMIAGSAKSNFTTKWHARDGSFWPLDENAIVAMSTQLQTHINQCFSASSQTMDGIADGTVTTLEQIDAAFSW